MREVGRRGPTSTSPSAGIDLHPTSADAEATFSRKREKERVPHFAVEDVRRSVGGKPFGTAIHATAVTIAGAGLLILGPSGAGKSRLAAALIAASTARRRIRLLGDDRILLAWRERNLVARPHPRIAGFIERRGFGIVACPFVEEAIVRGVVDLRGPTTSGAGASTFCSTTLAIGPAQNFPGLPLVTVDRTWLVDIQREVVFGWCATLVQHLP